MFDAWFAAMHCAARPAPRLTGYSSWYNRYQDISAASVAEDLEGYRQVLPKGSLFQIDDGWEPFVGAMRAACWLGCGWPPLCARQSLKSTGSTRTGC